MKIKTINRMIGYGILLFAIGVFVGISFIKPLQVLIAPGSLMTFAGIFCFFNTLILENSSEENVANKRGHTSGM